MTSSSNLSEVKDYKRRAEEREKRQIADIAAVLATPEGRRVLWRILSSCRLYETPFHSNGSIQSQNIGRGDVGRELLAWISTTDPEAYPKLMLEMGKSV